MAEGKHHWLRKDDEEATKASFPELFFDLVFVLALIQLSETLALEYGFRRTLEALLFISALWWVWIHTTWVTNLLDAEAVPVRLLLFSLMFLGIILAMALPRAFGDMGLVFALTYAAIQFSRTLFALYAFKGTDAESFMTFLRINLWLVGSGLLWIGGAFCEPDLRLGVWALALAFEYLGPVLRYWVPAIGASPPETLNISGEHLAERCALFVIVALGETILTTGKNASGDLENTMTLVVVCAAFLSTVVMWWIYFHDGQEKASDTADDSASPQKTAQYLFTYGHLPIIAGIILTAVGEDFSLSHPLEQGSYGHAAALLGGPILFLAGTMWMKAVASRYVPFSHLAGIALLAAAMLAVPVIANYVMQIVATAVLAVVATWEYVALRRLRPQSA